MGGGPGLWSLLPYRGPYCPIVVPIALSRCYFFDFSTIRRIRTCKASSRASLQELALRAESLEYDSTLARQ